MPKYLVDQDITIVHSKSYCVEAANLEAAIQEVKDGKVECHDSNEYPVEDSNDGYEYRYCDSHRISDKEWDEELGIKS